MITLNKGSFVLNAISTAFIATLLFAGAAQAKVDCEISTSDGSGNYNRNLQTVTVVENPSSDPRDRSRSRYVLIKPDFTATVIDSSNIDSEGRVSHPLAQAGDHIVWVQELVDKGLYGLNISSLTAETKISPTWDGSTMGTLSPDLFLALLIPRIDLAVSCELAK